MKTVVHLVTQMNQPFGSVRRCCERCGIMTIGKDAPPYTDDPEIWEKKEVLSESGYIRCSDVKDPFARTVEVG